MPTVEVSAPATSKWPGWRSDSLIQRGVARAMSSPMGTLTKSTHRQFEPLDEDSAREQADRAAARRDRGEHTEGPVALRPFAERRADQGEGGRGRDGAADALESACGEQLAGVLGEPAEQGGEREEQHAEDEDAPSAEDVAGPAAEQQQPAEGERVGADHPGQAGGGEVQGALDVRQRDVHDGDVQDHHELARGDHQQCHRVSATAGFPGGGLRCGGRLRAAAHGVSHSRGVSHSLGRVAVSGPDPSGRTLGRDQ